MKIYYAILVLLMSYCPNKLNHKTVALRNAVEDSLIFSNNDFKMTIYMDNLMVTYFKLINNKNKLSIAGRPELVKVLGEIPEGTNCIDYNVTNDNMGYECDSTYQYIHDNIDISFAIEKTNKGRINLMFYESSISGNTQIICTLVRK